MKRGDIVVVRGQSGATIKPRPCVVVQHSATLDDPPKITACPLTSTPGDHPLRPVITPAASNGLRLVSQIEVDWIFTERAERFGSVIGRLDDAQLAEVDRTLRRWLDL